MANANNINKTQKFDAYNSARFRLTVLYFLSMFVIIAVFSVIIVARQVNQFEKLHEFGNRNPAEQIVEFNGQTNIIYIPQGQNAPLRISDITSAADEIETSFIANVIFTDTLITVALVLVAFLMAGVTLRPVKDALEQQKKFIADASHEFKTPLAVIKTEAEVLSRDKKASLGDYKEFLGSTIEEVDRMSELTSSLLYIARADSMPGELNRGEFDISDLVRKNVKKFAATAAQRNVTLSVDIKPEKISIVSDKSRIEQLLCIFLDNAIKYNKPNGKVTVRLSKINGEKIVLSVEDTGIGIEKTEINKIFGRFYRVSEDRNQKGFGLGLSIAKQLVEELDAKVEVKSKLGVGTVVSVTF